MLKGSLRDHEFEAVKGYLINPVDSGEAVLSKPETLDIDIRKPEPVEILDGFMDMSGAALEIFRNDMALAMSLDDLIHCRKYFAETEKRNPTITEIKLLDTYWSDHCRHTTFNAEIEKVSFDTEKSTVPVKESWEDYKSEHERLIPHKPKTLMNLATINARIEREAQNLADLEISGEINACSIIRTIKIEETDEEWLIMFKNETHNHPTEIEPFGGAATCLGGCIRDPLSGRSFVYQAMRVTGSGDPREKIQDTIPGKLPQRKITTEAAHGYSSYGNQIGLATGQVSEIYHQGYKAKRMEVGAVIAAAPKTSVLREEPVPGDVIVLLGGKTGRDGIGGATGSSKEHTEESILTAGSEVQKGNPPEERKIQRLFRKPELTRLIRKCNDFGAGGVSVAIGELADGLVIDLDKVPKKYEGLDGTEIALSESQERMAVVVAAENAGKFIEMALEENLEAVTIATVTEEKRLVMNWQDTCIVNISREFIDTNGVPQKTEVHVAAPGNVEEFFKTGYDSSRSVEEQLKETISDINHCSRKGLVERFDSTVGAGTVIMPFGGRHQDTPSESMVAAVPDLNGNSSTCTVMSYGFDPYLSEKSPYHGALYAVVHSAAKIVAAGAGHKDMRYSMQEYFEKLGDSPVKWGKPFSALLGAYQALKKLNLPAIGGKDSMSGTFRDIHVPPTLIAFAVNTLEKKEVVSAEFKRSGSPVVVFKTVRDENGLPDFDKLTENFELFNKLNREGAILASYTVASGGIAEAVTKMSFGNKVGFAFDGAVKTEDIFVPSYGDIVAEVKPEVVDKTGSNMVLLGSVIDEPVIRVEGETINIEGLLKEWIEPLEDVFPTRTADKGNAPEVMFSKAPAVSSGNSMGSPRVVIPVFPGTNCEYDTAQVFEKAGAKTEMVVFRNLNADCIRESVEALKREVERSQIIAVPGGFSAGDEPEGSGKFITSVFRNPLVRDAVMNLLKNRDGLMVGICNGFQALIKLGLVPYGEIRDLSDKSPTLTVNSIGRHCSGIARTKVVSSLSPWYSLNTPGEIHSVPFSHGEGRFICSEEEFRKLAENGQIATQYVNNEDVSSMEMPFNPNGSFFGVEGITSPDGRVLGKMCHNERSGDGLLRNISGNHDKKLFEAGVRYFR